MLSSAPASLRSILKPVSLLELSVQPSAAWLTPPLAARPEGAAGGAGLLTVVVATFEKPESPLTLVARTRYE